MPISEFPGNSSWGYNPVFYMAPKWLYGRPNELKPSSARRISTALPSSWTWCSTTLGLTIRTIGYILRFIRLMGSRCLI